MLEQSALHGRVFLSYLNGRSLISKPVSPKDVAFGPMRPVQIYPISDRDVWMQDRSKGDWYHYACGRQGGNLRLQERYKEASVRISEITSGSGFFYYYGKALCDARLIGKGKKAEHLYFVQNAPSVSYAGIPDVEEAEIPLTLQALDYEQTFRYPEKIKDLLSQMPASYVDRYKRPVVKIGGHLYPLAMEKVTTRWKDLPETTYPVVLNFEGTRYAVADLEPDHTEEDLEHFNSLAGYYEEETPRGGRHKVIHVKDAGFKYRHSPGLEFINSSQVTLYGINARWISDAPAVTDMSGYLSVGHDKHQFLARLERPDVSREVAMLREKAEENLSMSADIAGRLYRSDPDDSHGEYVALRTLFRGDIEPYARCFEPDLIPWILEQYAADVIEHRDKHETLRNGVPYLVYLADIIIGKDVGKTWEPQKCTSSRQGR